MKKLKHITAILLLSLLILQSGGYLVLFNLQQEVIKKQVKRKIIQGIPENQLVVLKIPFNLENENSGLFKRIDKNEFYYSGEMYDIVRKEIIGEVTLYYCYHDTRESTLTKRIEQIQKDAVNNPSEKSKKTTLSRLIISPYLLLKESENHQFDKSNELSSYFYFDLTNWIILPILPPPKV